MRKPRLGNIYKPKRLLLETLVSYCVAANNTTLDQFTVDIK